MAELTDPDTIRDQVREKYAAAARAAASGAAAPVVLLRPDARCRSPTRPAPRSSATRCTTPTRRRPPSTRVGASLGCGVPTAVADLHEGETVLDLGSGAGADVLISARRVGATGRVIGLDMTDEMLELARANAAAAGVTNAEFVKGHIEDIPLADASVDVVISNCVINLSGDKAAVLREVARVLRPGGRFAVSDVIADPAMDEATRADIAQWTGCIAGALTHERVHRRAGRGRPRRRRDPRDAPRPRVRGCGDHPRAQAARRRRPGRPAGCCSSETLEACCEPAAKGDCCGDAATATATAPAIAAARRRSRARDAAIRPPDARRMTATRVAINGFGRMGRLALRAAWGRDDLRFAHVNETAGDAAGAAHLLCFDSVHGRWDRTASGDGDTLTVDGLALGYGAAAAPGDVAWEDHGVEVVLECSGQVSHRSSRCSRTSRAASRR